ncbi:MAG: hypothetical protein WBG90_05120 [Saonia sp.]
MQSVNNEGIYGEIEALNTDKMAKMLEKPEIDRVEVFNATPENLENRKKMAGKKYSIVPAYRKATKIKTKKK